MVPAYLMQVERIPMNKNGKVDKNKLPEIQLQAKMEYVAPTNKTEEILCEIFKEILSVKRVGIKDDFFELGGHSLRAVRLANLIEKETGARIAIKDLFTHTTPEQLAKLIKNSEEREYASIPHVVKKEYYPMSSAQKRMYMTWTMDEKSIAYNIPQILRLKGNVDVKKMRDTFHQLIQRHEVLRTAFLVINEELVQKIQPSVREDFAFVEDSTTDEAKLVKEFIKPFDLRNAALIRMQLVKRSQGYLFMLDMHHIVGDGMSAGNLFREFCDSYNGLELEPLTHQYKDYCEWMQTRDLNMQKEYWLKEFEEEISVLNIPTDYPRTLTRNLEGGMVSTELDTEICDQMESFLAKHNMTDYMLFLSATMVLLSKYSRQEDIIVGSPVSGRTHVDTENMLGMFVNTVALRGQIKKDDSCQKVFDEIKEKCLKMYENQEYPFDELVNELGIQHEASRNPLFDVMFAVQNNEDINIELDGVDGIEPVGTKEKEAKFDLTITVYRSHGSYKIGIVYCKALFREETIQGYIEHFVYIMKQMISKPETKILDIECITPWERECILHQFNEEYIEKQDKCTVIDLFEQQVDKTPNQTALVCGKENLTYLELNQKANQIAQALRTMGVKPNDFVALISHRDIEIVTGIYGIIKAGAAYVPIDEEYPEDRIQFILEDSNAKAVVVSSEELLGKVKVSLPTLDLSDKNIYQNVAENLVHVNKPSDLVYAIYTSGTTGRPKGVMIEHHNLVNFVSSNHTLMQKFMVEMCQSVYSNNNYIFDITMMEYFMPLVHGLTLILSKDLFSVPTKEEIQNYQSYGKMALMTTPSKLNACIQVDAKMADMFEVYMIGAEAIDPRLVKMIKDNGKVVINGYGPTETTCAASFYECQEDTSVIPIGKPIKNAQMYILEDGHLCGIGVPGELCIAGSGVARGYINLPELTSKVFVENLFGQGKMYHAGDLARWLPDGNIEYLGRMDEQVKIRGFRIELGEIEATMKAIEQIEDATVVARKDANGELALYAYYVAQDKIEPSTIISSLSEHLASYMVPAYIMQIERIPINQSGKVDKRKLPDIERKAKEEYVAPTNKMEEIICTIFKEILSLQRVGMKDDFFEIGGHSLSAVRLANKIEKEVGVRVSIKDLFANSTPLQLAKIIDGMQGSKYISIPKAVEAAYYEMSSVQKRMYLIWEMDETSTAYNIPQILRLQGNVDKDKILKAFEMLIKRHEILRTKFLVEEGRFVQEILPEGKVDFVYVEDETCEETILKGEFMKPFDLTNGSLIRMKLVKRSKDYLLMLDMHHIVGDGMSAGNLFREFCDYYNGMAPKPLTHQYKDYSEWMKDRDLNEQKKYWLNEYQDEISILDLPTDYQRKAQRSMDGAVVRMEFEPSLCEQVDKFLAKNNMTDYMLFLSATMVLLSKYSRQNDIIVGSPVSGRTHADTENMLGMFVNTVALRGQISKDETCEMLLNQIQDKCLKMYENQEYPFEELVKALDIQRDSSRNPIFDVMFVVQNNEDVRVKLDGIDLIEPVEMQVKDAKFDLTITIQKRQNRYAISMLYCKDLFKEETIKGYMKHLQAITSQMISNPERKISDVSCITDDERLCILEQFNKMSRNEKNTNTVIDLFEQQVEKTPNHIALVCEEETLTFRELNERANQIARRLRTMGIKPNDFVVFFSHRNIELLTGIYGIIKAGGAYVPIDEEFPEDRIRYIIEDCNAKAVVVSNTDILAKINTSQPILDLSDKSIYENEVENLVSVNQPEDLIYAIYTSGTSGRPKGVMVEHRNLVNFIAKDNTLLQKRLVEMCQCVYTNSNYIFDITMMDYFMPLVHGLTLILSKDLITVPQDEEIRKYQKYGKIAIITTPSKLKVSVQVNPKVADYFELYGLGGEVIDPKLVKLLREKGHMVINVYGPTETTSVVCFYECGEQNGVIPIGKPIENTQIYILEDEKLCGIGVPGELCIAGENVARGYINLEELTKEKFVENPFGEGKMYRSGDLAKWLPDGNIECIGRIDEQVKIRGFRIELGEIEANIKAVEDVEDAVVITRKDQNGELAIYAYYVASKVIETATMTSILKERLTSYMVPAYLKQIEQIPLTRNGKLDRRKLPEIEMKTKTDYIAPETLLEKSICELFEEVLSIQQVGRKDDFFHIGGHSLRAVRLSNLIEKRLGVRLSINTLFVNRTPEQLAKVLEEHKENEYMPIPQAPEKECYKMSSAQKRMYLLWELDETSTVYNVPQIIRLHGEVEEDKIQSAFEKLLERHEVLRTQFVIENKEFVQKILPSVNVDYAYVEDSVTEEGKLMDDFVQPFDLRKASVIRLRLVKRTDYYLLMLDLHHIVCDGMSAGNLFNEFCDYYNGKELEPATLQYKDYSEWMEKRDLRGQKEYWLNEYKDEVSVLNIPTDFPRKAQRSTVGGMVSADLSKELCSEVDTFLSENNMTDYMLFLTATMVLLSKYSGQDDIVVGSPVSGRTHADTEKMLGMFVNTVALRGEIDPEKTCEKLLQEMNEKCIKMYENQEYPFDELIEDLGIARDSTRNPLFDVMFVIQNNEEVNVELQGIRQVEPVNPSSEEVKFDLTITIQKNKNQYKISMHYCAELFKKETIQNYIYHLITIVEQMINNKELKIQDIECINQDEKELILHQFNLNTVEGNEADTIIGLFETQVDKTPDQIALVCGDEVLTYTELNQRANQIARELRKMGVRPNDFVGFFAERSTELITGIYGIIKAGAAYVPIDMEYPKERIEYILNDCNAKAIVTTDAEFLKTITISHKVLDLKDENIGLNSTTNLECINAPGDLIYAIYTSGTSGKPKGVMVEHQNLVNFVSADNTLLQKKMVQLCQSVYSNNNYIFDITMLEYFMPLMHGLTLILSKELFSIPQDEEIRKYEPYGKMAFMTTPSKLRASVAANPKMVDYFALYMLGAESIDPYLVNLIHEHGHVVINGYGPTETTCAVLFYKCKEDSGLIPIGKPIRNTQMYIMNHGHLCGVGVPGELYIAGSSVARGYIGMPELTEEKFVKNPFGHGRMYRSGDLVRWLPDGNIEYLGRIDQQVKIRGFRIELNEITEVLGQIPYIEQQVVIAREDENGVKAIFAYFVSDKKCKVDEIKRKLGETLPYYMVPTYMMQIDEIPMKRNGKIDQNALPMIPMGNAHSEEAELTEELLQFKKVIEQIIEIQDIGIHDNLFECGVDSIKMMLLAHQLKKQGYPVKIKLIMKTPTIKAIFDSMSEK